VKLGPAHCPQRRILLLNKKIPIYIYIYVACIFLYTYTYKYIHTYIHIYTNLCVDRFLPLANHPQRVILLSSKWTIYIYIPTHIHVRYISSPIPTHTNYYSSVSVSHSSCQALHRVNPIYI